MPDSTRQLLRCFAVLVLPVALALVVAAPATAACPDQADVPAAFTPNVELARTSLICLINEQRALNGLQPVTEEVHLDGTAHAHSVAMRKHRFFDHGDVGRRIRRSGYGKGYRHYRFGEALRWGGGRLGSPISAINAFMHSSIHRHIVLTGGFRDIGIGVVIGSPLKGNVRNTAIYTVDFGTRF